MKKLLIILFMLVAYLGNSQAITTMYPVDATANTDTAFYINYIYENGDSIIALRDTMTIDEVTIWLDGWEAWGQQRHNKWAEYQLRDSLFTDSIQALQLIYAP